MSLCSAVYSFRVEWVDGVSLWDLIILTSKPKQWAESSLKLKESCRVQRWFPVGPAVLSLHSMSFDLVISDILLNRDLTPKVTYGSRIFFLTLSADQHSNLRWLIRTRSWQDALVSPSKSLCKQFQIGEKKDRTKRGKLITNYGGWVCLNCNDRTCHCHQAWLLRNTSQKQTRNNIVLQLQPRNTQRLFQIGFTLYWHAIATINVQINITF